MTCSLILFISSYLSTMSSSAAFGSYALSSWYTHTHTLTAVELTTSSLTGELSTVSRCSYTRRHTQLVQHWPLSETEPPAPTHRADYHRWYLHQPHTHSSVSTPITHIHPTHTHCRRATPLYTSISSHLSTLQCMYGICLSVNSTLYSKQLYDIYFLQYLWLLLTNFNHCNRKWSLHLNVSTVKFTYYDLSMIQCSVTNSCTVKCCSCLPINKQDVSVTCFGLGKFCYFQLWDDINVTQRTQFKHTSSHLLKLSRTHQNIVLVTVKLLHTNSTLVSTGFVASEQCRPQPIWLSVRGDRAENVSSQAYYR